jgi:hypothetical protein
MDNFEEGGKKGGFRSEKSFGAKKRKKNKCRQKSRIH